MNDPKHLLSLLGKRVAMQEQSSFRLLLLYGILANGLAIVGTSKGEMFLVEWSTLENPYVLMMDHPDMEWEMK